jgi:hypothetical protein
VNALCHYPIVYRPRPDAAACGLFQALHGGLMRSCVESESWASSRFQRKKIKLRCNTRQMRRNLNFVSQRCDAILMNHFKPCVCQCLWLQILVVLEKPRHIIAQQYALNHFAAVSALPVHCYICTSRNAVVRRRVSKTSHVIDNNKAE